MLTRGQAMPQYNDKARKSQERFENALRDLFVGAPVEERFPAYRVQHAAYNGSRGDLDSPVSPG
jgi:hypothetical protein